MNFSCMLKKTKATFLFPLLILALVGCQNLRTRDQAKHSPVVVSETSPGPAAPVYQPQQPSTSTGQTPVITPLPTETLPPPPVNLPRIGIILSGGGAKAYAHIGFLQELARQKIPVHSVAGIEFASPMAALYAQKGMANDVEWQMFKIKDEDIQKKSLLSGSKTGDLSAVEDFLKLSFARLKVEDLRMPFACPAFNLSKNQIYLMSRGMVDSLLPYCWPYPPLFRPYKNNVAAIREVKMLADHLRARGANYIVFVNALGGVNKKPYAGERESSENIMWTEIAAQYAKAQPGIDAIVNLNTEDYGVSDFSARRDIMQKGASSAEKMLKPLARRWGL